MNDDSDSLGTLWDTRVDKASGGIAEFVEIVLERERLRGVDGKHGSDESTSV
jgi:hypothetical protein